MGRKMRYIPQINSRNCRYTHNVYSSHLLHHAVCVCASGHASVLCMPECVPESVVCVQCWKMRRVDRHFPPVPWGLLVHIHWVTPEAELLFSAMSSENDAGLLHKH